MVHFQDLYCAEYILSIFCKKYVFSRCLNISRLTRNDQLPLTDGPQMLMASNVSGWCAELFIRYSGNVP